MHKLDFTDLAKVPGNSGRGDCQWGWLDKVRDLFKGLTVLDVGTGLSTTKARLPESYVCTHEACEDLPADFHGDLAEMRKTHTGFNAVTCMDVIEHVRDYGKMAQDLARLSYNYVFLTTPGAEVTHNESRYHFHEFHPWEILQLMEATGMRLKSAWAQKWAGPTDYSNPVPPNPLTGVIDVPREGLLEWRYLHPVALLMEH